MKWFNIVHHDGSIQVHIDHDGHAIVDVHNIKDREILIMAINRAFREGARSGTLFSGDTVNVQVAAMNVMRAETGTTWLNGKVTRLPDGPDGPRFRIDWETFPHISE